MRTLDGFRGPFDGIWANGCLYHLSREEFAQCLLDCLDLLLPQGILYLNMKEGAGERFEEKPGPNYPGGRKARALLQGRRFYTYYRRAELLSYFIGFEIEQERRIPHAENAFEFWLRRT